MKKLIELFFPKRCVCCGKVVRSIEECCSLCYNKLSFTNKNLCPICEREKLVCGCFNKGDKDDLIVPLLYEENSKLIIRELKYKRNKYSAKFLAKLMINAGGCKLEEATLIMPVPMSDKSKKEGRYNQAYWLAKEIADYYKKPCVADILHKKDTGKTQHKLSKTDRLINAEKSYYINGQIDDNSIILLVDDVYTTGATINTIAKKLKDKGAGKVIAIAAAIRDREDVF